MFAVVVAGGVLDLGGRVPPPRDLLIAADSGLDHAYALGLRVDYVVGDMDSVSAVALERAETEGVRIERHPPDKDATDLELALDRALELGATSVLVLATGGGRADHELANLLLLASPRYRTASVAAWLGSATLAVVRGRRRFLFAARDQVTLLAVGGPASGITTTGLAYPLRGETLEPGSSRGVSNVVAAREVTIEVIDGVVITIHVPAD